MELRTLADVRRFSPEKLTKTPLFESPRMYCDVYGLLPGQAQKIHAHAASDKIYWVLDGCATFTIGGETASAGPGAAVLARAGEPHGVRNDGDEPLSLVVIMAPKPG